MIPANKRGAFFIIFRSQLTSLTMATVYRTTLLSKIIYSALPLFLGIPFVGSFIQGNAHGVPFIPIAVCLLLSAGLLYLQLKRQILLDSTGILYRTAFKEKALLFSEMEGFRIVTGKNSFLKIIGKGVSNLQITSISDFKDKSELVATLSQHCPNLDVQEKEAQMEVILQDERLGSTKEERAEALKSNTRIAAFFNMTALVFPILGIISHITWLTALCAIWPLLGLGLLMRSQGRLKFITMKKNSPMPSLILGFAFPTMALFFTTFFSYNLIHASSALLPAILFGLVLATLIYTFGLNKYEGNIVGQVALMLVVSLVYGFSAYLFLNATLDKAPVQIYPASILDRGVTHGKSDTYWITLTDFGPYKGAHRIDVSHSVYDFTQIGDTVKVDVHPGKFNLAWYDMETPKFNPPTVKQ